MSDVIPIFPLKITFEYTILPPLVVEHVIRLKILLLLYANYSTIESLFLAHWLIYQLIVFEYISEHEVADSCSFDANANKQQFLDENQFTNQQVIKHLLPIHMDDFSLLFTDEVDLNMQRLVICTTLVACMIAEKLMGADTITYGDWNFYKIISGFYMFDFVRWEHYVLKFIDYRLPIATDLLLLYENRLEQQITTHEILTSLFDRNCYTNEFLSCVVKHTDAYFTNYKTYVLNMRLVNTHRVFYFRYETIGKKLNFTKYNTPIEDTEICER